MEKNNEIGWTPLTIQLSKEFTDEEKKSIMYDNYQRIAENNNFGLPDDMITDIGLIITAGVVLEVYRCLQNANKVNSKEQ